jgi:serine/threonine protein kinase
MELVVGPTLSALIEAEGPLAPARVLTLSGRIADALHAASVRGVVHRDLTPSNIFVCEGDWPKIGDFGVAKLVDKDAPATDALPKAEPVVGTAGYMSPEQGLGDPVDARSDIYSLGCVMYRMVTGKVPFTGNSLYTVLLKHMNEPPPPMESPHGPIPEPLSSIILRALAKRPNERYQSAEEMLADITNTSKTLERGGRTERPPE